MASMGVDPATLGGCQLFVTLRRGKAFPKAVDIRVKYEETMMDLKAKVAIKSGVPVDSQQLFWHGKEMTDAGYGHKTLGEMNIHTGFGITGYDLREPAVYWPPVETTPEGLRVVSPPPPAPLTRADMGYTDGLSMEEAIAKYRGPGAVYWSELKSTPPAAPAPALTQG